MADEAVEHGASRLPPLRPSRPCSWVQLPPARLHALSAVRRLLSLPRGHLLLSGPAGVGKRTLALLGATLARGLRRSSGLYAGVEQR